MNIKAFLEFHIIIEKLKHIKRTGWVLRGIPDPETVASHSFRMSLMVLTLQEELLALGINLEKLLKMTIYHDIGESIIGDIVPEHVKQAKESTKSSAEKFELEQKAIKDLATIIGLPEIVSLWEEMEEGKTQEAQIVKDIDILEMALQAWQYQKRWPKIKILEDFMTYCQTKIKTTIGQSILRHINSM